MRRTAQSPAPHCAEVSRGQREVDGGRRSDGAGCSGNVGEIGQIWMGKFVDGLEGELEEFEFDVFLDWEPVEILYDQVM